METYILWTALAGTAFCAAMLCACRPPALSGKTLADLPNKDMGFLPSPPFASAILLQVPSSSVLFCVLVLQVNLPSFRDKRGGHL